MLVSVFAHSVYHDGCVLFRKGGAILAIGSDVTYSFRYTYILIYLYTYILIYLYTYILNTCYRDLYL